MGKDLVDAGVVDLVKDFTLYVFIVNKLLYEVLGKSMCASFEA